MTKGACGGIGGAAASAADDIMTLAATPLDKDMPIPEEQLLHWPQKKDSLAQAWAEMAYQFSAALGDLALSSQQLLILPSCLISPNHSPACSLFKDAAIRALLADPLGFLVGAWLCAMQFLIRFAAASWMADKIYCSMLSWQSLSSSDPQSRYVIHALLMMLPTCRAGLSGGSPGRGIG